MNIRADTLAIRPCTWVYVLLLGLTLATWAIGGLEVGGVVLSLLVLAMALVKGDLIGEHFMGLRRVRGPWRWVIRIWLIVPGLLITTAFLLASGGG